MENKLNKILEKLKSIDISYQNQIKNKETQIKILEAEIEQLYGVINSIQSIGELISIELDRDKEVK